MAKNLMLMCAFVTFTMREITDERMRKEKKKTLYVERAKTSSNKLLYEAHTNTNCRDYNRMPSSFEKLSMFSNSNAIVRINC